MRRLWLALLAPLLFGLHGCASTSSDPIVIEDLEGSDESVQTPFLRLSYYIDDRSRSKTPASEPRLELEVSRAAGDFSQDLDAGERVSLESTDFDGPMKLTGSADISYASLRFAKDNYFRHRNLGLEWTAGLGHLRVETELKGGGQTLEFKDDDTGVSAGGSLLLRNDAGNLVVRAKAILLLIPGDNAPSLSDVSGMVEWAVTPSATLAAGWRRLLYDRGEDDPDQTNYVLDYSGPTAGLQLNF